MALLLVGGASRVSAQEDSLGIYHKIEHFAAKHKVTQWIYDAIFIPTVAADAPQAEEHPKRRRNPALKYAGRPVRHIDIHVMDPFGYSVLDTSKSPTNKIQQVGNALHRRTRERIIRNLMLLKEGDAIDPLKVTESERVLRASPVVNDASVKVVPVKGVRDSVDVIVMVLDKWNFDVYGEGDLGSVSATFRDRNLLGYGQEVGQSVVYIPGSPKVELDGHHSVYNIRKSYISSRLSYFTSADVDRVGISLDRGFYSPLARWAGGVAVGKSWANDVRTDTLTDEVTTYRIAPVSTDVWLARSFKLDQGESRADQSSNIIVGARYAQVRYARRTPFDVDTLRLNSNTSLALVSAGLSFRQYYKDRYLYRFGANEDIPEGSLITVTTGLRKRELERTTPYSGVEISRGGNTEDFGYLSGRVAYGTFYDRGRAVDGTLRVDLDHFTDLVELGRWHLRQFVRARGVIGFNKPIYLRQNISGSELYGFDGQALSGTYKLLLNLETVMYMPYTLLGFRFAPIVLIGLGTVGQEDEALFSNTIYPAFSLGVLVRNENLLVKTFEVSVGYTPKQTDGTTSLFKLNPSISFSLNVRDFAFARPDVVSF
ncbi:MAG: hypothetical protein IPP83_04850 [Flavobacteriales bacterium]|nr:hypothetical protein [Flavobacteriales bacterium]